MLGWLRRGEGGMWVAKVEEVVEEGLLIREEEDEGGVLIGSVDRGVLIGEEWEEEEEDARVGEALAADKLVLMLHASAAAAAGEARWKEATSWCCAKGANASTKGGMPL